MTVHWVPGFRWVDDNAGKQKVVMVTQKVNALNNTELQA